MEKTPFVISVEGGVAAGKTSYISMMEKELGKRGWKVKVVDEPVEKWKECGILDLFYKDPKRWGYHFQTKAFHDRVQANIDAYESSGQVDIFLLERSPFTDNMFMDVLYGDGLVTDLEYKNYKEWWSLWYRVMPYTPNLFIYLRPDLDTHMERIKERNRKEEISKDGEGGVTREYQSKLISKHDQFFIDGNIYISQTGINTLLKSECVTLCTNENFRDDPSIQKNMADHLEVIIKSYFGSTV